MPTYLRTIEIPPAEVGVTLLDFPGNATKHKRSDLDYSISQHGQVGSVKARELSDGTLQLLAGHGTKDAIVRAGKPVLVEVYGGIDDEQARQLLLILNKTSDDRDYDEQRLLTLLDQGLEGTGWDEDAYRKLLEEPESKMPDPGDAPTGEGLAGGFGVIVECDTEEQQVDLLEKLLTEGFNCRSML